VNAPAPRLTVTELARAGRHLPPTFELALAVTTPAAADRRRADGPTSVLRCEAVLRLLPGRRLVARVRVDGRLRALKLFFGPGARRYFRRERRGCEAMRAAGVATPALAGAVADTDGSARGLLFDWIEDATPLSPFDQAGLASAAAELARLHASGWRHGDLHLDNFLVAPGPGRPQLIDGDGVRRDRAGEVARAAAIDDLATLCAQRPPRADDDLDGIWRAYAGARGWADADGAAPAAVPAAVPAVLLERLGRQRRARLERYLRKTQRDCSEFRVERSWRHCLLAVRACWRDELAALLRDPEAAMAAGEVVKAGNSATVVRVALGASSCIVKRYNLKNAGQALRRNLRGMPRFRRAWAFGQGLHLLEVATARPLALLERRAGPWRGVAYLVMEDVGRHDLAGEIAATGLTDERLDQVVALFTDLGRAGLTHGDTKATNLLVDGAALRLVDLDAMALDDRGRAADLARFLENFEAGSAPRRRFAEAFAAAGLTASADGAAPS